jgi:hypothetical protein
MLRFFIKLRLALKHDLRFSNHLCNISEDARRLGKTDSANSDSLLKPLKACHKIKKMALMSRPVYSHL